LAPSVNDMITSPRNPSLRLAPTPASSAWRLLVPGDQVSIGGTGVYEIVHMSHGRAWLEGADGSQRLADASSLRPRRGGSLVPLS